MFAEWPTPADARRRGAEAAWSDVMALTRAARTLRADYRIEPAEPVAGVDRDADAERAAFWRANAAAASALCRARACSRSTC